MEREFREKVPVATSVIIGINLVVWVFLEIIGSTQDSWFMVEHGASYLPLITENGEWWRLFTCMFLHFGADHLIDNMLMLFVLGFRLEHAMGSVRFTVLYLLSGMCGSLLSFWEELPFRFDGDFAVSAGASGAVFGVMGALIAWAVLHKGRVEGLTIKGLLFMAALSLYYGFTTAGIDQAGHIGGFFGGLVLGGIFGFKNGKQYTGM